MKGLTISKQATLSLTADDWQLYTSMPGVNDVAMNMNLEVASLLNSSATYAEFWSKENVLKKYDNFGARDSEPMWVLEQIAAKFYGLSCR